MYTTKKMILRRFFEEIYNQGDLRVADEIIAPGYRNHDAPPGQAPGREGLKAFVAYLRRAFADFSITIEDQVVEGDKVATRYTIRGMQEGEFAGVPPTGKLVEVTAIGIHRIVDGQIQEGWLNWDALGLMQQLSKGD